MRMRGTAVHPFSCHRDRQEGDKLRQEERKRRKKIQLACEQTNLIRIMRMDRRKETSLFTNPSSRWKREWELRVGRYSGSGRRSDAGTDGPDSSSSDPRYCCCCCC